RPVSRRTERGMAVSSEPTRVRGSGRKPRRLLLCLLLAVCGAPALASASPPDPLHLPGIYDDADHDDVLAAILPLRGTGAGWPPLGPPPRRGAPPPPSGRVGGPPPPGPPRAAQRGPPHDQRPPHLRPCPPGHGPISSASTPGAPD